MALDEKLSEPEPRDPRMASTAAETDDCEHKVALFGKSVIFHPAFRGCTSRIAALHRAAKRYRGKARGMLITGLSGCGKSKIAEEYALRFPPVEEHDCKVMPVLHIELPGQPTAKVLGEAILQAMGDPMAHVGSAEYRMNRVRALFSKCQVELVFIDEMQHLTDNLDSRARDIAADTLKNLMNETGIPFVFLGLPSCRSYFKRNQQLGRRCTPKSKLKQFGFGTPIQKTHFLRLLKTLDEKLPLKGSSALVDAELAWFLHVATYGLLGMLIPLVEEALFLTLSEKAEQLTKDHLRRAFLAVIYEDASPKRNPFDEKFNGALLTGPDEPYFGYGDD